MLKNPLCIAFLTISLTSLPVQAAPDAQPEVMLADPEFDEILARDTAITIKINQHKLEQNGFQISSRLLDLAQRVS